MKYTIFHVDESRAENVERIRKQMRGCEEIPNLAIDGRGRAHFEGLNTGQSGVWLSFLAAIAHAPVLTLDDDAILRPRFGREAEQIIRELPEDADFFALYQPPQFASMFKPKHEIGHDLICRAYQPNGAVAMYYTEQGREHIKNLIKGEGIAMQYDNQLFNYSWRGLLNGYGLKPGVSPVRHDDAAPSTVQENNEV